MDIDPELLRKILDLLEKMIPSREDMISWLEEFIDDVRKQEIAVNSVKTTTAAVGVISFIGLFTPFAPLAVVGMAGSGVAGVVTTVGDLIATKIIGGKLDDRVKKMREDDLAFNELMKKVEEGAKLLQKELNISDEDAILFLLVGVPKALAQTGIQVMGGAVSIGKVLPHLKSARSFYKLGASFTQSFKLGRTLIQGAGRRMSAMTAKEAAKISKTLVISTTTKVLGGLGAAVDVGDVIYSWATKNPNRKSAEELLSVLKNNVEDLKQIKKELSQLKNN